MAAGVAISEYRARIRRGCSRRSVEQCGKTMSSFFYRLLLSTNATERLWLDGVALS